MLLRAAWAGRLVPRGRIEGEVHSVFQRACNIRLADGSLVALLAPDLPRTPWALRLAEAVSSFREFCFPGMRVVGTERALTFPDSGVNVRLDRARPWTEDSVPPFSPERARIVSGLLETFLARQRGTGGPKDPGGSVSLFNAAGSFGAGLERSMKRSCMDAAQELAAGFRTLHAKAALEAAERLLGVGPGLTPAGDDFIVGALAGLACLETRDTRRAAFSADFRKGVRFLAKPATNGIAFLFIDCAAQGLFAETVADLGRHAARSDLNAPSVEFFPAASRLLSFGATSGEDTLHGLLCSLKCFF